MNDAFPLLIGGEWVRSADGVLTSVNPATGETNYAVCAAGPRQVDDAVAAASEAASAPSWRNLLPHARARLLAKLADVIESRGEEFARTQMQENGKVLAECRAQSASAAAIFRYYAAVCETVGEELTPSRGRYFSMTVHEPYGVVAAITPWNSPLTMEAQKVAPAIAGGNAVILKPSEITPSPALALGRAALDAGLPPGILNVLPGAGAVAGDALVRHKNVRFVSFTGGTASGRRIAATAAEKLMPVALELGGKSPHIVFADADLDAASAAVADGIFEASGQSCVAGSRLFVEHRAYDRVLSQVVQRARALKIDLPDAPGAQLGPIASFAHRERIERFVAEARNEGGEIVAGGARPDGEKLAAGAYYLPTVITGLANSARACQQEIFGPVLCVLPFEDEDDLVRQANDSVYGLAAGLWTADYRRAWRVARRLEAGTVWINTYKQLSIATAFGGFKESGIGREKGIGGLRLYQQAKSLYFGLG
ncbi:MAG TPA: aldehyde dehydrogenase [Burkholderiales bacterium]|nr:aldehyde dehydrogenase [Burkholderiales bacterium]